MKDDASVMEQAYIVELRKKIKKVKRWCKNQKKSFRNLREEVIGSIQLLGSNSTNMSHSKLGLKHFHIQVLCYWDLMQTEL